MKKWQVYGAARMCGYTHKYLYIYIYLHILIYFACSHSYLYAHVHIPMCQHIIIPYQYITISKNQNIKNIN